MSDILIEANISNNDPFEILPIRRVIIFGIVSSPAQVKGQEAMNVQVAKKGTEKKDLREEKKNTGQFVYSTLCEVRTWRHRATYDPLNRYPRGQPLLAVTGSEICTTTADIATCHTVCPQGGQRPRMWAAWTQPTCPHFEAAKKKLQINQSRLYLVLNTASSLSMSRRISGCISVNIIGLMTPYGVNRYPIRF